MSRRTLEEYASSLETDKKCIFVEDKRNITQMENMENLRRNQNSTNSWVVQYFVLGMYIRGQGSELFRYCETDMVDKVEKMLKNRFSKTFKFSVAFFLCAILTYTVYYFIWLLNLRFDKSRQVPATKGSVQYNGHSIHVADHEITKFFI